MKGLDAVGTVGSGKEAVRLSPGVTVLTAESLLGCWTSGGAGGGPLICVNLGSGCCMIYVDVHMISSRSHGTRLFRSSPTTLRAPLGSPGRPATRPVGRVHGPDHGGRRSPLALLAGVESRMLYVTCQEKSLESIFSRSRAHRRGTHHNM